MKDIDTNYENRIKFDDILSNENIDSEKFNSFMYRKINLYFHRTI